MSIRESIKTLILSGSSIHHSVKKQYEDWYGDVYVRRTVDDDYDPPLTYYVLSGDVTYKQFLDPDAAVDAFCRLIFTPDNLAIVVQGAHAHGLGEMVFDDDLPTDLKAANDAIWERYRNEFFALDYPEFAG